MTLRIQNKTNSTIHINNSDDWSTPIETTGYAILLFIIILMLFFLFKHCCKNANKENKIDNINSFLL